MYGIRLDVCLVLFLAAASVHHSYGGELSSICTESSDCNYDGGFCIKFDQCNVSWCYCKSGYTHDEGKCKKQKKVGEACNSSTEACEKGRCTDNVCKCSDDSKDDDDLCGKFYGETCENANDCFSTLTCSDNKCGCKSYEKTHISTHLFGISWKWCINSSVVSDVKANGACSFTTFCDTGLMCIPCSSTEGKRVCMSQSGAGHLSVSALMFGCLFTAAMLNKFY